MEKINWPFKSTPWWNLSLDDQQRNEIYCKTLGELLEKDLEDSDIVWPKEVPVLSAEMISKGLHSKGKKKNLTDWALATFPQKAYLTFRWAFQKAAFDLTGKIHEWMGPFCEKHNEEIVAQVFNNACLLVRYDHGTRN